MDRLQFGQQRLGEPIMAAFDAVVTSVDKQSWTDFQREPVGYYFSKMLGGWLLKLSDAALSDEQLGQLSRPDVLAVSLLLHRDMFRHSSGLLRPATAESEWVDSLFQEAAGLVGLAADRLADDGRAYELENMADCGWARPLAAPFGFPAEKLFACHSSIVSGIRQEFST